MSTHVDPALKLQYRTIAPCVAALLDFVDASTDVTAFLVLGDGGGVVVVSPRK